MKQEHQTPSYAPTGTHIGEGGWGSMPDSTPARSNPQSLGDDGMVGSHQNDRVMLHNAHPHTEHSVGYDSDAGMAYKNHGIDAVHIVHGKRQKNNEHHPPLGLWDPGALQHGSKQ